jgi:drug/metabolite transporter (DMT)-like permease
VSLGTGRLAPSVATVSVLNPIVGVLLGVAIFDERFSRPTWHVVVAIISLLLALGGAVLISLSSQPGAEPRVEAEEHSAALA